MKNEMLEEPKPYLRPELIKLENVRNVTLECANWQCSVAVPPPPA